MLTLRVIYRDKHKLCFQCGYSAVGAVCSECGAVQADVRRGRRSFIRATVLFTAITVACVLPRLAGTASNPRGLAMLSADTRLRMLTSDWFADDVVSQVVLTLRGASVSWQRLEPCYELLCEQVRTRGYDAHTARLLLLLLDVQRDGDTAKVSSQDPAVLNSSVELWLDVPQPYRRRVQLAFVEAAVSDNPTVTRPPEFLVSFFTDDICRQGALSDLEIRSYFGSKVPVDGELAEQLPKVMFSARIENAIYLDQLVRSLPQSLMREEVLRVFLYRVRQSVALTDHELDALTTTGPNASEREVELRKTFILWDIARVP